MSRSDLVNHPMVTGCGPQRNGWFGDEEMEDEFRRMTSASVTPPPFVDPVADVVAARERLQPHSPAWAYVLVTMLIGLLTGALIAWLHR
jgi:hypothetical protein